MSKRSFSKPSQTDWTALEAMEDKDIDLSEIPEISRAQMARAKFRFAGKLIPKGKVRINILLDAKIVAFFKTQAGGRGYQTLINEALKQNLLTHELETTLRRVIREELKAHKKSRRSKVPT